MRFVLFFSYLIGSMILLHPVVGETSPPSQAAKATNALGLKIFHAFETPEENLCLSPYSITAALAMTYPGASGETLSQMEAALSFPSDPAELAAAFRELDLELLAVSEDEDLILRRANRLFGQQGFAFRPSFLELVQRDFVAPLEELHFHTDPQKATETINLWVEKETEEKIRDLIPANAITDETTLVLVNTLYLKAPWLNDFPISATEKQRFLIGTGGLEEVDMMQTTASLGYRKLKDATAVTLPYRGNELQFLILLPDGDLVDWEGQLNAALLEECLSLPEENVTLSMPKFRLAPPTMPLGDVLKNFGMPSAFDEPRGSADFSAMATRRPNDYLYLSNVFHKTFIEVDEKGTEAAAATAVVMMRALAMPEEPKPPIVVIVDRPFIFAVQHRPTGTCLFLGRVTDPR